MTKRNFETLNHILDSAKELGLSKSEFSQVGPTQWDSVLQDVIRNFTSFEFNGLSWPWDHYKGTSTLWLWEYFREPRFSFCPKDSATNYGILQSLLPVDTLVWLVTEDSSRMKKNGNFWVLQGNYGSVLDVLWNCHPMEFYIVDRAYQWLLAENHHNYLIGVGDEIVEKLKCASQDSKRR